MGVGPRHVIGGLAAAAIAFGAPSLVSASHVSISASVAGQQLDVGDRSVTVRVTWNGTCHGAESGASWFGSLSLDDPKGSGSIYMGGVSGGSGSADQLVGRAEETRAVTPVLRLSCASDSDLHGSETVVVRGQPVEIPGLADSTPGGGSGGGGSGGGSDDGDQESGRAPPGLPAEACRVRRLGTAQADRLTGTADHERLLGRGGHDRLAGRGGHDCLYGEAGNDWLSGGDGDDALYGGAGRDRLSGGRGVNQYDAGAGADVVRAANGRRETVRCGPGDDRVRADRTDRLRDCERVTRVG
jgi:Ca2+-binding RTX toxin-like protein